MNEIHYNGAKIIIRNSKIRDKLHQSRIIELLRERYGEWAFQVAHNFATLVTRGKIEGKLAFDLPEPDAEDGVIVAAFEQFCDLEDIETFYRELTAVTYESELPKGD